MSQPTQLKIICLNTWAGMAGKERLLEFFTNHQDIDVFCLQEIWNGGYDIAPRIAAGRNIECVEKDLLQKICATLPNHRAFFTQQYAPYFGIATLVRNNIDIIEKGEQCVYREPGYVSSEDVADHARPIQYVTLNIKGKTVTILNFHGAWQAVGKIDTPERLQQSRRIIDLTNSFSHPLILCGDFNLSPETRSVKMIEDAGWENLIRTHNVTSTRTSFYTKPERFADYIFVKNNVKIQDFHVLPEEVSDHAALFLECEI